MANLMKKRFTKSLIETMAVTIADHMHNDTIDALHQECIRLSGLIYDDYYTDEEHKLIQSLPSGYLPTVRNTTAYFVDAQGDEMELMQAMFNDPDSYRYRQSGNSPRSTSSYSHIGLIFPQECRLKSKDYQSCGFRVRGDSKLIQELIACNDQIVDVRVERLETIDQMEGMFAEFSNFDSLYAHWPAVREILRKHEPKQIAKSQRALPPATVFDNLNKKLGIPTEKVIQAT